jgi:hypothetical protein
VSPSLALVLVARLQQRVVRFAELCLVSFTGGRQVQAASSRSAALEGKSLASFALDDDGAVVGAHVSMLPHLSIGEAVIPGLCLFEGRKLENDHAFDRGTLKNFLAPIVDLR